MGKMEEPNAFSIDETEEDTSKVDEKKEDAVEKNETSKKSDTGLPDEHVPEKQEDEPVLRKEDQGKIIKKSNQPNGDPLLGATAYVYQGVFKGLSGTITLVQLRGWWTIDNPKINKKIQCTQCKLVDDGAVDMDVIKKWYAAKEKGSRVPPIIVRPGLEDDWKEGGGIAKETAASGTLEQTTTGTTGRHMSSFKRKIAGTDFTGNGTWAKRRKEALGVIVNGGTNAVTAFSNASNIRPVQDGNDDGGAERLTAPPKRDNAALNPVLVHQRGNGGHPVGDRDEKNDLLQLLPAGLHQLSQETKIEIFNRRTGKIMRGDQAVLLSDLPMALVDHAEYEPIVPPSSRNASITTRIGRSGPNVRINSNVVPQSRVRASRVEGRNVVVTGGEYRGLSGTIDSCIPGGWYLVSNLFKNDDLDVVISSAHLELISEIKTSINDLSSEGQGVNKIRIHLNAAKLRLKALAEEREQLENCGPTRSRQKDTVQLKKLEGEVSKTNRLIADLQVALTAGLVNKCG